jgi:enoyl-CoA hydratase
LIQAWENLPMQQAIQHGIDSFAASWDTDEPARMMGGFLDAMRRRKMSGSHGGNNA